LLLQTVYNRLRVCKTHRDEMTKLAEIALREKKEARNAKSRAAYARRKKKADPNWEPKRPAKRRKPNPVVPQQPAKRRKL